MFNADRPYIRRSTKTCIRCSGQFLANRRQVRCDPCRKAYKNDPQELLKRAAQFTARGAIRAGRLIRQPCEICGRTPADGHHDDYAKPLEVRWLCAIHHRWEHDPSMRKDRDRPRPYETKERRP